MSAAHPDAGPSFEDLLQALRPLTEDEKQAAYVMLQNLAAGQSLHAVGMTFLTSCGWSEEEAQGHIASNPVFRSAANG